MAFLQSIFTAFKRCLSARSDTALPAHPPLPSAAKQPPAEQNYHILQLLQQTRQLLEVKVDQEKTGHQSMILAVDSQRGLLWLDELLPRNRHIEVGDWLSINHQREGEVLTIRTPVVAVGARANTDAIAVMLPDQLAYIPRREFRRYQPQGGDFNVRVRTIGESAQSARVINISGGGMRLALTGNQLTAVRRGVLLPLCRFRLGGSVSISCRARVKSCRLVRSPYRHTQVSIEYTDLAAADSRAINAHLQRLEQLKHNLNTQAA